MSEELPDGKMSEAKEFIYEDENQFKDFLKFINEYFELEKKWMNLQNFLMDHPVASLFLIITMAICSIPIIFFGMFVLGTLAVALVGFLIFEGTALTLGTLVLGFSLCMAGLFSVGFATFLLSGYYMAQKCLHLFSTFKNKLISEKLTEPDSTSATS